MKEGHSKTDVLNIESLDLRKYTNCDNSMWLVHVAEPKPLYGNSEGGRQCEVTSVNFTNLASTSNNQDGTYTGTETATNSLSIPEGNYKKAMYMETWLISVLVVSTIAHGVSIIAFVFSYRK